MTIDRNDILYWYPRLARVARTPRTEIVLAPTDLVELLDGEAPAHFESFMGRLERAIRDVGGRPAFLRTGHFSGKHSWTDTCFYDGTHSLGRHIYHLVEDSHLVDLAGLPAQTWAVREYLEPAGEEKGLFWAFKGTPIRPEARVFIDGGSVVEIIPYWPAEAIEGHDPSAEDWRTRLAVNDDVVETYRGVLRAYSNAVAREFSNDGAWSVDWLLHGGLWYAIDMAEAHRSWGCPDALKGVSP